MKEIKLFSKMPSSAIFAKKNFLEEFKREIEKIYNTKDEFYFKNIANMIYEKISSDDLDYRWTREEYGCFRKTFSKMNVAYIDILYNSIEACLKMSNTKLYEELNIFSNEVDWYPFQEKVKDKNTNLYVFLKKDIQLGDCFLVSSSLVGYMLQFIDEQAMNYVQFFSSIKNVDDMVIFIEQFKENKSVIDSIMIEFRNKFGFVKNYILFANIYYCVEETLMDRICQKLFLLYSLEKDKEEKQKKAGLGRGASDHALKLGKWQKISEKKRNNF